MSDTPRRCASCGTDNVPTARFCAQCGTELTIPEPTPEHTPERRPPSRFPVWAVAAIVVGAVVAGGVAFAVVSRGSDTAEAGQSPAGPAAASSPAPATGAVTATPTAIPSPAPVDQLLALVPPEPDRCIEADIPPEPELSEAIATVVCAGLYTYEDVVDDVSISFILFPTAEAATAAYGSLVTAAGIEPDSGRCSKGSLGETSWSGDGGAGRLSCRPVGKGAVLIWTSEGFPVLGLVDTDVAYMDVYHTWQQISDYERDD